jgi:hypothetical protein
MTTERQMNGCVAIDFRPGSESVPHILETIGERGFDLYGLHLIPSCEERWTLNVDIGGWWTRGELEPLATELKTRSGIIDVIHHARPPAAA